MRNPRIAAASLALCIGFGGLAILVASIADGDLVAWLVAAALFYGAVVVAATHP